MQSTSKQHSLMSSLPVRTHHQNKTGTLQAAYLDEQLAGAQDEAGIGVADASGELTESTSIASVGVGAEQHLSGLAVTLLHGEEHRGLQKQKAFSHPGLQKTSPKTEETPQAWTLDRVHSKNKFSSDLIGWKQSGRRWLLCCGR
eukprot:444420-Pelagomonas_calceolata.AAC.5